MKSFFSLLLCSMIFLLGCSEDTINTSITQNDEDILSKRVCFTHEVLQEQLKQDPSLVIRMQQIEDFTERFSKDKSPASLRLLGDTLEIPVIVNVLYKTTAQNISSAQIQSQITALNNDFEALNTDYNLTPSVFQSLRAGNTKIRFVLDGIIRKSTTKTGWNADNSMKSTAKGGISPSSPTTKLNMWVCNLSGGILGYAQFPGGSSATDGVVIDNNACGTIGTVQAPFDKGRTGTHEVGHWMNLRHIWGDADCGSDLVTDTPNHNSENYGCPTYPHYSTCSGKPVEMTMNYMDYSDDACMYMFTSGQKTRMRAIFASGGPRYSFGQ